MKTLVLDASWMKNMIEKLHSKKRPIVRTLKGILEGSKRDSKALQTIFMEILKNSRNFVFLIQYPVHTFAMFMKTETSFWIFEEVDLSKSQGH